jgi:hypothetical protein
MSLLICLRNKYIGAAVQVLQDRNQKKKYLEVVEAARTQCSVVKREYCGIIKSNILEAKASMWS